VEEKDRNYINLLLLVIISILAIFTYSFSFAKAKTSKPFFTPGGQEEIFLEQGTSLLVDSNSGLSVVSIADMEISEVSILSQEDNKFQVAFKIKNNSDQLQPNIRYKVYLTLGNLISEFPELDERGQTIYSEEINLKGKGVLTKNVEYIAPEYLKGSYSLWVKAMLPSGIPVGMNSAKDFVILEGKKKFVEIIPESCKLLVEGVTLDKEYKIIDGIAIDPTKEKLIVTCKVNNHFGEPVEFSPFFEIYSPSIFGKNIGYKQINSNNFKIKPGTSMISFPVPTAMDPQNYVAKLIFKKQEEVISNSIFVRYILKGVSATIQNVSFDKPNYLKGEKANVNLFWLGSADAFPGSRVEKTALGSLTAKVSLSDKNSGRFCGQIIKEIETESSGPPILSMEIPIVADCENPVVSISIEDGAGNILFQQVSKISEENGSKLFGSQKNISLIILSFLAIFVVAFIIYLNFKERENKKLIRVYQ
jgi:hypothetical protein